MSIMMKPLALALVLAAALGGCKKQEEAPPRPKAEIPMAELKRGRDACTTYVEKICKCAETVAAAKEPCALGKAYPEAIEVGMQTVANTKSESDEVKNAAESIRKTMATCIEEAGRLPTLGCAP